MPPPRTGPADLTAQDLADALLAEDEHTATLVDRLTEQEDLVRLHREELHHTNQGVLALHAELETAAEAQHELLDAERAARADAEKARRLLTFLADASAAVTASLDLDDIRRRLPELLVPDFAEQADIWLFDDEDALRGGDRPAAAVTAARSGRPQHAAPHPGGLPGVDDLPPSVLSPDRPLLCIPLTAPRLLGVLEETPYEEQAFHVEPGDRLIVVSTGVHGTRSATGDIFGERALRQVLGATGGTPPHETARAVVAGLIEHFGGTDLAADAAVVCLDWTGRAADSAPAAVA
ncbi:hypothetical protein SGLAM104S_07883 [Streptomyces glaucescens]